VNRLGSGQLAPTRSGELLDVLPLFLFQPGDELPGAPFLEDQTAGSGIIVDAPEQALHLLYLLQALAGSSVEHGSNS